MIYTIIGLDNNFILLRDDDIKMLFIYTDKRHCDIIIKRYSILCGGILGIKNIDRFIKKYFRDEPDIKIALFNDIIDDRITYTEIKDYTRAPRPGLS